MMLALQLIFWIAAAAVVYTYAGYPLMLAIVARLRPRRALGGAAPQSLSVVIAAKNEAATIGQRTEEFLGHLAALNLDAELIIVSDGSSDGTVECIRAAAEKSGSNIPYRIIELPVSGGKAAALSRAAEVACKEIIVFADARQTWDKGALPRMLEAFGDPSVGAVSGELILETAPGVMAGMGAYWRYEKWIRRTEGKVYSMVGATGAISAVRRPLFRPIPAGTILDDVYWPLNVALQGRRVVQVQGANAYDRLPEKARDEFRRKVRTLSGNFQLAVRLPAALLPWRNPIWMQYVSHKLMRLAVPWLLLVMLAVSLALSIVLPTWPYRVLFAGEILFLLMALAGLVEAVGARSRLASAAASFLVLNAAAFIAFWVWASGRSARSWKQLSYDKAPGEKAPSTKSPSPEPVS